MRFDNPTLLWLIPVAAILLLLLGMWAAYRKRQMLERFGNRELVQKLARGVSRARQRWKFVLFFIAIMLVVLSLARPQYGIIERPLRRRGVEVVIAVDCSRSMLGQDMKPNRLERARQQLRGLIQRLEGDSVSIVVFAGIALVQCPMTSDYSMALNLLDAIEVGTVPTQGTDLGAAIQKSMGAFQNARKGRKIIVLLTDGEGHEGKALEAAEEAAREGVTIYTIGIGSTEGVPIPLPEGGYMEAGGSKVSTRLDFETLTKIAFATGGQAILANPSGDMELEAIYSEIKALDDQELQTRKLVVHKERFQYFLAPAALLLVLEMIMSDRRRRIQMEGAGRFD
ncbi:MAG: vWA domain-containing protein [Candidatus Sumerlaeia bacterium]